MIEAWFYEDGSFLSAWAFIDLTRAFDLVSRDGLFKILPKIGCPPQLLDIMGSFHDKMKGTVVFDG